MQYAVPERAAFHASPAGHSRSSEALAFPVSDTVHRLNPHSLQYVRLQASQLPAPSEDNPQAKSGR
jgi:uncharacterized protein (UPF0212 family)